MSGGRLFLSRLPATAKARSPTVTSLVVGMMTSSDDDERRRATTVQLGNTTDAVGEIARCQAMKAPVDWVRNGPVDEAGLSVDV